MWSTHVINQGFYVAHYYVTTGQIQNWLPSLLKHNFLHIGLSYQAHQGTLASITLQTARVQSLYIQKSEAGWLNLRHYRGL